MHTKYKKVILPLMIFAHIIQWLLMPLAWLYGGIILLRNIAYDFGWLKSVQFELPIIAIGNLSVGGTGKTPHIECLIRLLGNHYRIAVLSRGYKRKSKGYRLAQSNDDASVLGDEPLLIKRKYPSVDVCVAENRMLAIPQLLSDLPQTQIILMDDAFQHRSVKPNLSVLLTTFNNPYFDDYMLPAGRLREFTSEAKRADFIIVTKSPSDLSESKRKEFIQNIKPEKHQKVLFSSLQYGNAYNLLNPAERISLNSNLDVYLFCGIASTTELEEYVKSKVKNCWLRDFTDHHYYDRYDLENILTAYESIESENKILLTTEKDAARLVEHSSWFIQKKLTIFALPVEVQFFNEDKQIFDNEITNYLQAVIKS
jgi:tetraacyldisaccharide 4'-kinase